MADSELALISYIVHEFTHHGASVDKTLVNDLLKARDEMMRVGKYNFPSVEDFADAYSDETQRLYGTTDISDSRVKAYIDEEMASHFMQDLYNNPTLAEGARQGVASAMTSRLAIEILHRGKVPFYCAAWSNIRSVRNAVRSGFRPAWVEMTAEPCKDVDEMNGAEE